MYVRSAPLHTDVCTLHDTVNECPLHYATNVCMSTRGAYNLCPLHVAAKACPLPDALVLTVPKALRHGATKVWPLYVAITEFTLRGTTYVHLVNCSLYQWMTAIRRKQITRYYLLLSKYRVCPPHGSIPVYVRPLHCLKKLNVWPMGLMVCACSFVLTTNVYSSVAHNVCSHHVVTNDVIFANN
jgi:hypothetical protein